MANRFLTPNASDLTGLGVRRFFCVDSGLAHFLTGCLDQLTKDFNWQQFGDLSPVDMSEIFEEVIASMDNCSIVGQVVATFGTVPDNCLALNGQEVLGVDYPLLAAAVPDWVYAKDQDNPEGIIALPDLTDAYLVGASNMDVGQFSGANTHTLTVEEMPPHTHDYQSAIGALTTIVVPDEPSAVPAPAVTSPAGGGLAHNNMPYSIGVIWSVVAK